MSTAYDAEELVWIRMFDVMVPVLSIARLSSTDSWTRRVLTRAQPEPEGDLPEVTGR